MQFNENLIDSQDTHIQIWNDDTPGAEYANESDSEKRETKKTSALPNFILQILRDDEIT